MKHIFTLFFFIALTGMLKAQSMFTQPTYYGPMYLHECSAANIAGHVTTLDDAEIGNNGSDKLIFTHRYQTPAYTHAAYLTTATGIYYYGSWAIFDETFANLDPNLAFNVLNVKQNGTVYTHTVTAANVPADLPNCSLLDHPLLNNNPLAMLMISKTWDNQVYNTKHVGVYYDSFYQKWCIYNEDNSNALPLNSTFNIFIPNASSSAYKHTSTENNYITVIDNTLLNGNVNANIFVVHDWGSSGPYLNHEIGVWYDGEHWTIYTEDKTVIPAGTIFNIVVASDTPYVDAKASEKVTNTAVYPNPAIDKIQISGLTKSVVDYIILDDQGKVVMNGKTNGLNEEINIGSLATGLYFIKLPGTTNETLKFNVVR